MTSKFHLPTRTLLIFFIFLTISYGVSAQEVEVQGQLKVTSMTTENSATNLVVRLPDGKLAERAVSSLPNSTGLEKIIEGGQSGWRLIGQNPSYYGNIGNESVDLSLSVGASSFKGAYGLSSLASGFNTTALGDFSTAFGLETDAQSYAQTTIGSYNDFFIISGNGEEMWNADDPVFVIGNGSSVAARSNALIVYKSGAMRAPSLSIAEINQDRSLITREYLDSRVPIAYGTVESDGNILSGTGNFTASVNSTTHVFTIDVTGTSLGPNNSATSINVYSSTPRSSSTLNASGDLKVYIFDGNNNAIATTFQFVIYGL